MSHIQTRTAADGKKTYIVRYEDPTGAERSKSFSLLRQAKKFKTEVDGELESGAWVDPDRKKVKLREVVEQMVRHADNEGTRNVRQYTLDNLGRLGHISVGQAQRSDVRDWLLELTTGRPWADGKVIARSSARTCLIVVKAAYNQCVHDGVLLRSPAKGVQVPESDTIPITRDMLLTPDEVRLIQEKASPVVGRMILFCASTGLRPGELGGLRVRSVDLGRRELHVTEQVGRKGKPWNWKPLKTGPKAVRTLPLPRSATEVVQKQLEVRDGAQKDEPLFLTRKGGQFTASSFGEAFGTACDRAGLTDVFTPRDLRHFYASALIQDGRNPKTVQARLGHANSKITMDTYTHLWPGEDHSTRDAIDRLL
jgi:integrase